MALAHCLTPASLSSPLLLANPPVVRRTGNYKPTLWDYRFIESLTPNPAGSNASITQRIEVLKECVKDMLNHATDSRQKMNLVDTIDRLGLTYHFSEEIQAILQSLYEGGNLVALRFRLLRRQGYYVPLDVFDKFEDKEGKFDQSLRNDVRGLLSLYEALAFTTEHLKSMSTQLDRTLAKHVEHSLTSAQALA